MAFPSWDLLVFLLLALLAVHIAESRSAAVETTSRRSLMAAIDCNSACDVRCGLSSRPNLCKRACGTCCYRCGCVPPGTSGNKNACPCYANLTTSGGRPKCP
ncbi:hypothetical protein Taro_044969 [Colocasia esculenta]|uniref:Snakin-2 n=1 Tax=Colocasia esculenta TaxID=4460 RepID=A0A843WQ19_COLES|nr:hypothetical protein [Colocasia esculenta]